MARQTRTHRCCWPSSCSIAEQHRLVDLVEGDDPMGLQSRCQHGRQPTSVVANESSGAIDVCLRKGAGRQEATGAGEEQGGPAEQVQRDGGFGQG